MVTAITTCVNYDDYLSESLPLNRPLFDNYYIITTEEDTKTQKLAQKYDCSLIITDVFKANKAVFNKGRAINIALEKTDGWVCHLDADIVLETDEIPVQLDKNAIYGCVRYMCPGVSAWKTYCSDGRRDDWEPYAAKFFVVNNQKIKKWLPLGFFQLWYSSSDKMYPENCLTAADSDVIFSLQWHNQLCLDSISALHLPLPGSYPEGANWRGRTTKRLEL